MTQQKQPSVKLIVIIPLYRSPELIEPLYDGLVAAAEDLKEAAAKIVFLVDSPDDLSLIDELERHRNRLDNICELETIINEENIGFIKSTNIGLEKARFLGCDALLLNSDAILTKNALSEMRRVAASDPMIAFVSPRSNNATICNSPYPDRFRDLSLRDAEFAHRSIEPYLNDITYVPTAVGFCLYIKSVILQEFGVLSEVFGLGYNEENDLIFRSNKVGFRAALANKSFVAHVGSVSFNQKDVKRNFRELKNRIMLDKLHPEYARSIERFFSSPEFHAQRLLSAFATRDGENIIVNFDCNNIGPFFNGTVEHSLNLIRAFAEIFGSFYDIHVSCSTAAANFHNLGEIGNITVVDKYNAEDRIPAIVFRIGQPFDWQEMIDMTKSAPISGYLMLDTISLDCLRLDTPGLKKMWTQMLNLANVFVFNSEFSRDQFIRRFGRQERQHYYVSRCAISNANLDICSPENNITPTLKIDRPYILVVGNDFPHKNLDYVVKNIIEYSQTAKVVVLGREISDDGQIVGLPSGSLKDEEVERLYKNASVLLFPTFYEGFGLPIVKSLAAGVPVVARDIPVFREIKNNSNEGHNLHLFSTTAEMMKCAAQIPAWRDSYQIIRHNHSWYDAARHLNEAFQYSIRNINEIDLTRRLSANDVLEMAQPFLQKAADLTALGSPPEFTDELSAIISSLTVKDLAPPDPRESANVVKKLQPKNLAGHARSGKKWVHIEARGRYFSVKERDLVGLMLDANRALEDDGTLLLLIEPTVFRQMIDKPVTYNSSRLILLGAISGFSLVKYMDESKGVAGYFQKQFSWWNDSFFYGENDQFIEKIYQRAFNRQADPESQTHIDRLEKGESRYSIAKKLFASKERLQKLQSQIDFRNIDLSLTTS